MKLKITSDGHSQSTHVIDIETGQRVENVKSITWSIDADTKTAKAQIVIIDIPVDVEVSGKTTIYEKSITIEHE